MAGSAWLRTPNRTWLILARKQKRKKMGLPMFT